MATAKAPGAEMSDVKRLKLLKFSRRGKKSAITKRVAELQQLVAEGGSRRRIQFLMEALLTVYREITEVCLEISILSDEIDEKNDLDSVKAKIDSCSAQVTGYLDTRRDEPSSSGSLCSQWVEKHAVGMMQSNSKDSSGTSNNDLGPEDTVVSEESSVALELDEVEGDTVEKSAGVIKAIDRNGKISGGRGLTVWISFQDTRVCQNLCCKQELPTYLNSGTWVRRMTPRCQLKWRQLPTSLNSGTWVRRRPRCQLK